MLVHAAVREGAFLDAGCRRCARRAPSGARLVRSARRPRAAGARARAHLVARRARRTISACAARVGDGACWRHAPGQLALVDDAIERRAAGARGAARARSRSASMDVRITRRRDRVGDGVHQRRARDTATFARAGGLAVARGARGSARRTARAARRRRDLARTGREARACPSRRAGGARGPFAPRGARGRTPARPSRRAPATSARHGAHRQHRRGLNATPRGGRTDVCGARIFIGKSYGYPDGIHVLFLFRVMVCEPRNRPDPGPDIFEYAYCKPSSGVLSEILSRACRSISVATRGVARRLPATMARRRDRARLSKASRMGLRRADWRMRTRRRGRLSSRFAAIGSSTPCFPFATRSERSSASRSPRTGSSARCWTRRARWWSSS